MRAGGRNPCPTLGPHACVVCGAGEAVTLRLLRGRVMLRPIEPDKSHGGIIIPDPQKRTNTNTLGRGVVLAMGEPALTPLRWDSCDACDGTGSVVVEKTMVGELRGRCPECEANGGTWKGGVEIPPHFKIGDEVFHVGQHVSRDNIHPETGERVRYCAQEEVQCVLEP